MSSGLWKGFAERLAFAEAFGEACKTRLRRTPVIVLQYLVEIAERITRGDIGEAEPVSEAELALAEVLRHRGEAALDLVALSLVPLGGLHLVVVVRGQHGRVGDAV